jgi:hypothetical protein
MGCLQSHQELNTVKNLAELLQEAVKAAGSQCWAFWCAAHRLHLCVKGIWKADGPKPILKKVPAPSSLLV